MVAESLVILHCGVDGDVYRVLTEAFPPPNVVFTTEPDRATTGDALLGASTVSAVVLEAEGGVRSIAPVLQEVRGICPDVPVLLAAYDPSPMDVVAAFQGGAADFLALPVSPDEWKRAVSGAVHRAAPESRPEPRRSAIGAFVGRTAEMTAIGAALDQIAMSNAPVLIQGETGSGKEVLARELHGSSRRADKPFFKLNCAALPAELVESELFGYERGAFTGAFQRKPGIFETANGGTVMLDEIGDMDVRLQAKLLQVLQDNEFQRIGGKETIRVDVRIIAATHRDLEAAMAEGNFREDLYYRLNVVNLVVPPLRERKQDIPELFEFLLKKHARQPDPIPAVTAELREAVMSWQWPGNVRELENFARKFLIFQDAGSMARDLRARATRSARVSDRTTGALQAPQPEAAPERFVIPVLEEVREAKRKAEASAILAALNATRWNRKHASALLKVDYKALLYKMKKYGLDRGGTAGMSAAAS